ncbi:hypothetical protein LX81_00257 [Palleronia aestuarii]|uniref:SMODS and SLOG-associating 2TM effector domain-containing protein n=1 Tax=Palleronia aestuarii TaxID=568105 RepID=A0A2W7NHA6_9RHOB|nr:hypothetical protein [Palleronia aestuarii]PZX19795.1 hypothetical protein LX81_00257 [Palleronia aestuarii]
MTPDRDGIRFNVLRNAHYHTARRRGLERANRIFSLLIIVLGAAAVGDAAARLGVGTVWIGAAVAFVGSLQLVFDFGRQARDHQALQRDYYRLLAEIERTIEPTAEQLAGWHGDMIAITADEPPTMRALDARAYNDTLGSLGYDDAGDRLVVPWQHIVLGHVLPFEGYEYRKRSEIADDAT